MKMFQLWFSEREQHFKTKLYLYQQIVAVLFVSTRHLLLFTTTRNIIQGNDGRIGHFDSSDSQIFVIFAPANQANHEIDLLCKLVIRSANRTNILINICPIGANQTNINLYIRYIHPIRSICCRARFDSFDSLCKFFRFAHA